ncbi:MAG: AAA family ATPase [Pseudanabaena sp.]
MAVGQWADLKNYVLECSQLLYQIFFQPYTLRRRLRDIHPSLDINSNPFLLRNEFVDNPDLERYAEQTWWLTAVVPVISVLLVAPIYSLFSGTIFNFLPSSLFLLGWWLGIWLAKGDSGEWSDRIYNLLVILGALIILFQLGSRVAPDLVATISKPFTPIASLIPSLRSLIPFAGGVAVGVAFGVAVGVAVGVAFGVAFVLGVLRGYFWLPEFIWLVLVYYTADRRNISQNLRYLPPYFDQLIHLPLPFMSELIAEAHQQNPLAARSTIDYLTNFTNQQAAAARAMLLIAVGTLDRCQTSGDIAASGSQLDWIPRDDETFGSAFAEMQSISQSVNAVYQATSPYRRLELLEKPLNDLQALQNNLAFQKSAKFAPIFGPIAARWQNILHDSQCTLTEAAQKSPEIPNRYIAGNALDPDTSKGRFKGRADLFRAIEDVSLSDNPPVWMLHGHRRTGKTSALKYLPNRIGGDLIPLFIDCQKVASSTKLSNIAQLIANGIVESAWTARKIKISPIDPDLLLDDPFYALQNWMQTIEQQFPHKRFLLCFDEFESLEEVVDVTNSPAPLNFLRNVMQHQKQWILLFCGSHSFRELKPYWSSYLISTRTLRLTYLNETEARDLILHPVPDFPDIYDADAINAIIHLTHCQPFFVQLVCSALVETVNNQNRDRVTLADVQAIPLTAIERADGYFNEFWGKIITTNHQELLIKLINKEPLSAGDQPILSQLIQMEILERITESQYQFQVPLIQKFVESLIFNHHY